MITQKLIYLKKKLKSTKRSEKSKSTQRLIKVFRGGRGSPKKMLPSPPPFPSPSRISSVWYRMFVYSLENKLPKRIAIAKGDTVLAVEPGERKEFELELPLQVIIGKSGAVQERYDIEDAGDYKVHIRHTYEAKMAITNLTWHDIDSHWFGDGHKYDIVMELDPETNRAMFTIYRRSNFTSDRNFEIAFDGLLQWKNQNQRPVNCFK
jgi:hypothetical protein